MKKYFVITDIHSFGKIMKQTLWNAGFRKSNKDHILISLGDNFDRGPDSQLVYDYLNSIPNNRRILIKGNHEYLYQQLLTKKFPDKYDFSNGTVKTFCNLANIDETVLSVNYKKFALSKSIMDLYKFYFKEQDRIHKEWTKIQKIVLKHPLTKWLTTSDWLNYYELDNYIFVHSFIPLHNDSNLPIYNNFAYKSFLTYFKDWRTSASKIEWLDAGWGCPWKQFTDGLFDEEIKNNKILVCGHWDVSDFHINLEDHLIHNHNYNAYIGKNLIGLDANTCISRKINVLIIER